MRRIISVLAFLVLMTGCANGKFNTQSITGGPCGNVSGYTFTAIAYGTGALNVIPISNIRANTEWRFYLKPIAKLGGAALYGDSTVTISGKPAGTDVPNSNGTALVPYVLPTSPPPPLNKTWLSATGDFNVNHKVGPRNARYISTCVPANVQAGQDWHFMVKVDDVGTLDPRGRVQ